MAWDTVAQKIARQALALANNPPASPAVLYGAINLSTYIGVTKGDNVSSAVRQANLTALQAAITDAINNNKFLEGYEDIFEIEGVAGLVIPQGTFKFEWHAAKGLLIRQFSQGPILTIGDVTNTGTLPVQDIKIDGLTMMYGASQAGQATPVGAFRLGNSIRGQYRNIVGDSVWNSGTSSYNNPAPTWFEIGSTNGASNINNNYMQENVFENLAGRGAINFFVRHRAQGSRNAYINTELMGAEVGFYGTITDKAFFLSENGAKNDVTRIEGLTLRNIGFTVGIQAKTSLITSFRDVEVVGCRGIGSNPCVFFAESSVTDIQGLLLSDYRMKTTEGMDAGGAGYIFGTWGRATITGRNIHLNWSGAAMIDRPFALYKPVNTAMSALDTIKLDNIVISNLSGTLTGSGAFTFDANMPAANHPLPYFADNYTYHRDVSEVNGPLINVNANMTIYGGYKNPVIMLPTNPGAARTVTLSNASKASGTGAALPPPVGNVATVMRTEGTADANAITVNNSGGTAIGTLTTSNSTLRARYDGTNWVAA